MRRRAAKSGATAATAPPGLGSWSQAFELPELAREEVFAAFGAKGQALAVRAGTLGTDLYREGDVGLILARAGSRLDCTGVELDGRWLDVKVTGPRGGVYGRDGVRAGGVDGWAGVA